MQPINIGQAPRDGEGDGLREGGRKINENFEETEQRLSALEENGVGMEFISNDPDNRLERGSDGGLYSRDNFGGQDLLFLYTLAKG